MEGYTVLTGKQLETQYDRIKNKNVKKRVYADNVVFDNYRQRIAVRDYYAKVGTENRTTREVGLGQGPKYHGRS